MWVFCIEEKSPHTIPPYSDPILSTSFVIRTAVSMYHNGRFCSNSAGVSIQVCLDIDEGSINVQPHLNTVSPLNLQHWNFTKSSKSSFKELPNSVLDAQINEFRRMEAKYFLYDARCDETVDTITALVLVNESEKVLKIFLRIIRSGAGTGIS